MVTCFGTPWGKRLEGENIKFLKSTVKVISNLGFVTVTSRIKLQNVSSTMRLLGFVQWHLMFPNIYFKFLCQIVAYTICVVSSNHFLCQAQSLSFHRCPYGPFPINLWRFYC
jgi:hypothetical protein